MKKKLFVVFLALVIASVFVLTACGGGGGGGGNDKKDEVTITLHANGGYFTDTDRETKQVKIEKGKPYTPPTDVDAIENDDGRIFSGNWTTKADGTGAFTPGSPINANITLYAVWVDAPGGELKAMLTYLIDSLDEVLEVVQSADKELYAAATLFVEVGTTRVDVNIKGSFSSEASEVKNNAGLLKVTSTDSSVSPAVVRDWITLYVREDVIYIGDGLTQDNKVEWFRLSIAQENSFLTHYFAQLPKMIFDMFAELADKEEGAFTSIGQLEVLGSPLRSFVSLISGLVGSLLPNATAPSGSKDGFVNGDYSVAVDLKDISGILDAVSGLVDVKSLLAGLDDDIMDIVNMVADVILGTSLDNFLGNTVPDGYEYPVIKLETNLSGGMLKDLKLSYDKGTGEKAQHVSFGIINIEVSKASKSVDDIFSKTERDTMDATEELCVKANLTIELPNHLDIFQKFDVVAYVKPLVTLNINDDNVVFVTFENFEVFGYTYYMDGEVKTRLPFEFEYVYVPKAGETEEQFRLAFSIEAMLSLFVDPLGMGGYYFMTPFNVDLGDLLDALGEVFADPTAVPGDDEDPTEEPGTGSETPAPQKEYKYANSTNLVDKIVTAIDKIITAGFGEIGGLVSVVTAKDVGLLDIIKSTIDAALVDEKLSLQVIANVILGNTVFGGSQAAKDLLDLTTINVETLFNKLADLVNEELIEKYGFVVIDENYEIVEITAQHLFDAIGEIFGLEKGVLNAANLFNITVEAEAIYDEVDDVGFSLNFTHNDENIGQLAKITLRVDLVDASDMAAGYPEWDITNPYPEAGDPADYFNPSVEIAAEGIAYILFVAGLNLIPAEVLE